MIVCLGDATAEIREWEDLAAAEVSSPAELRMLGEPGSTDGSFFTVRLSRMTKVRANFSFGIGGSRPSSKPMLLGRTWSNAVWMGADSAVFAIDIETGQVTDHSFESPFVEFFVSRTLELLILACESGMRCFGKDGIERWRIDTDLIEDLHWAEESVMIEKMGRGELVLELKSGRNCARS